MLVENRRVGNLERVLFLKTIPTLAKLPSAELAALAEHARELFFARGSALMRDGEPVRAVYHVLDGSVRLRRHGRDLGLADRRTAVGALLLLARDEQGLSAVAESDAFTLGLDANSFLEVLEERFAIFHGVLRELSRDLVALMTRAPADARAGVPAAPLPRLPERDLDLVGRLQLLRSSTKTGSRRAAFSGARGTSRGRCCSSSAAACVASPAAARASPREPANRWASSTRSERCRAGTTPSRKAPSAC